MTSRYYVGIHMLFHTLRCCWSIFLLIVTNMIDVISFTVEHGALSMSFDWCACLALNVRHTWKIRVSETAAPLAILTMHIVMASVMSSLLLFHYCPAASGPCSILDIF